MKTISTVKTRQRGFFDFGLSVLIIALSGVAVYSLESNRADALASAAADRATNIELARGDEAADPASLQ